MCSERPAASSKCQSTNNIKTRVFSRDAGSKVLTLLHGTGSRANPAPTSIPLACRGQQGKLAQIFPFGTFLSPAPPVPPPLILPEKRNQTDPGQGLPGVFHPQGSSTHTPPANPSGLKHSPAQHWGPAAELPLAGAEAHKAEGRAQAIPHARTQQQGALQDSTCVSGQTREPGGSRVDARSRPAPGGSAGSCRRHRGGYRARRVVPRSERASKSAKREGKRRSYFETTSSFTEESLKEKLSPRPPGAPAAQGSALPLIPRTSPAGRAAPRRARPGDVVTPGAGTASAVSTPRLGNSSGAAASDPRQRAPDAAHPAPRNKQCCYERRGGVCPRRHFSSSPFQVLHFASAWSILHTSAFAQCQPLPAASARTQPGQRMPNPFWNAFVEMFEVVLTRVLLHIGWSRSGCAQQGVKLSPLVTQCQECSS